ncbi:MAG: hypothetical protein WC857_03825 [Candidatus Paceibacterota bacterium]|jgi:hypothetical protein
MSHRFTPARLNEVLIAANASRLSDAVEATTLLREFMDREDLIGSDDTESHVHVPDYLIGVVEFNWSGHSQPAH